GECDKSNTVDSNPTSVGPASRIISTLPESDWRTWCAVVGEISPERFALGAAIGKPVARINCLATGWLGIRKATVAPEADTIFGNAIFRLSPKVSGPGQNRCANSSAWVVQLPATSYKDSRSAMCTISGLFGGRLFTSKIRETARTSKALAPNP